MQELKRLYYDSLMTGIGELVVAAGVDGLEHAFFHDPESGAVPESWQHEPAKLRDVVSQLGEYFAGKRREFELRLAPSGTEFQKKVWQVMREIPYGTTITYGELAERVGSPKSSRAVGNANGRNPLVIIQPCHRVVAAGGALGGFSCGLHRKKFLLGLERGGYLNW